MPQLPITLRQETERPKRRVNPMVAYISQTTQAPRELTWHAVVKPYNNGIRVTPGVIESGRKFPDEIIEYPALSRLFNSEGKPAIASNLNKRDLEGWPHVVTNVLEGTNITPIIDSKDNERIICCRVPYSIE